jgi:hypothetical protein
VGLLDRFFGRVSGAGNGKKLELPPVSASDDDYFQGVAKVLMSPEGLPDEVGEALYMVDEMSSTRAMTGCTRRPARRAQGWRVRADPAGTGAGGIPG